MDYTTLIFISLLIIAIIIIFIVIMLMRKKTKKKMINGITNLDIRKNNLASTPILAEISKVEELGKSKQVEEKIDEFKKKYELIKEVNVKKINDMIVDLDMSISISTIKEYYEKYTDVEIELYETEYSINSILDEIKEISSCEEKYRSIVTKLKNKYRLLEKEFDSNENIYGMIKDQIRMQFETIEKRFKDFETVMDQDLYNEVTLVVNALDAMIDHIEIIIKEVPDILLLVNQIIPSRIEELSVEYEKMINGGYPLGYINFKENIESIIKKENDVLDRAKVLNIDDSLFDLKTILEYLDSLFKDFDKEKLARKEFDENNNVFSQKLKKIEKIVRDMYAQMDDIKALYDLKEKDLDTIDKINLKLSGVVKEYKTLLRKVKKNDTTYRRINVELEKITTNLNNIEEDLDLSIKSLGSMYDDEMRAREQLEEIKDLLKKCKIKIRSYKIPIITNNYFVELSEANDAIKEITKELERKPIIIKTLNTRVDTARDLVFKLYSTTNEMIKRAYFTELLVVYGNRYRSFSADVDRGLNKVEILYYKGSYQESYDLVIRVLDTIEKGFAKKIIEEYK